VSARYLELIPKQGLFRIVEMVNRGRYRTSFGRRWSRSYRSRRGYLGKLIDVEEAACAYVLGFGAQMEVLKPLELRDRILQLVKEAIAFYTER